MIALKVAYYYSFQMENINIFKLEHLKQPKVSTELLVTAIDVKHNFTFKNDIMSHTTPDI